MNGAPRAQPTVSLVIPVFNEEESLPRLFDALDAILVKLPQPAEVVLVDDGSTDRSFAVLTSAIASRSWARVVRFRRNFGQTAALAAGIDHSRAPIIVALDADLQNDPEDIPAMLKLLDEGYDVVSGWRQKRQDKAFTRKLPSAIANWVIGRVSGLKLHDYGCTLKAYRRFVLEPYTLYGEMHRFIPIYASWTGARVTEMVVRHHPRVAGQSKYGLGRAYKVLLDLLTVSFLGGYATKPIYFFGKPAIFLAAAGFSAASLFVFEFTWSRITHNYDVWIQPTTLLLFAVFTVSLGVQLVLMGLLGEIVMRTYYESQSKKTYLVRQLENFDAPLVEVHGGTATGPVYPSARPPAPAPPGGG
jgi:glycosyltransferase involved in cell wall biosynthesis